MSRRCVQISIPMPPLLLLLLGTIGCTSALIHYKANPFNQVPGNTLSQQTNAFPSAPENQLQQSPPPPPPLLPSQLQQPSQVLAAQQPDQLQQQQQQQIQPPSSSNGNNQLIDGPIAPLRSNNQRSIADGQTLPHPIFRFQGYALNSTSIKLIWNLNVSAPQPPEYFDIDYGPIPDATNLVSITKLNKTTRDYTINGLTPDTPYQFMLKSWNREQDFEPKLFVLRTPSMNSNGAKQVNIENSAIMPLGVKAEAKSNSSIQLSWTEPPKPDNLFNSLRVNSIRYFVNSSQYPISSSALKASTENATGPIYHYLNVTNPRESRVIVQKLKPATEYAFAVKTLYYSPDMKKLFSQSGYSMDTFARTFELPEPSAPRNFSIRVVRPTSSNTTAANNGKQDADPSASTLKAKPDIKLELTWLAPESPNGQLKGYYIFYANDSDPDYWTRIEIDDPKAENWHVTNVSPGVTYYFKMRAINQRGQSQDSDVRQYMAPPLAQGQQNQPIPPNNLVMLIIICMMIILFLLSLIVSRLACRGRSSSSRKHRKGSLNPSTNTGGGGAQKSLAGGLQSGAPKLNGFTSTNSAASTVTARVGTLARRRTNNAFNGNDTKPDCWINAMDQQQQLLDSKSNISEKSNGDLNMAMVSIRRDSPQFATTQLAPTLPDYRQFASTQVDPLQQQQQHSHYHPGLQFTSQALGFDQIDNATASALMTLSKRQQQQMQKYQIQFASTASSGPTSGMTMGSQQAPSPHQQPPPPPPLNIEQQQQQQQHHHHQSSLYGTHQPTTLASTRSLRLHQRTLYDPVSGSFLQSQDTGGPPNYNSHLHAPSMLGNQTMTTTSQTPFSQVNSNTLQFHPHQSNTLLSRRSTNTLRSFQTANGSALYGQLGGANGFAPFPPPSSMGASIQQPQQLLQSHQAVINQLNNSTYPSLPLKHVSAVRPQIMSSLEDQIEIELAEKEPTIASQHSHDSQQQQQQQQPQPQQPQQQKMQ